MTAQLDAPAGERWCRTAGMDDLGLAEGSGLTQSTYLLKRADGQVVQVSELVHLVVREVSAERDEAEVASIVSSAFGRELTPQGLRRLLTTKLVPLGLVENVQDVGAAAPVRPATADPLLALRFRRTLISEPAVRTCARVMAPMFHPLATVAIVLAAIAIDVRLFLAGSITGALSQVLATPVFLLALLVILSAGALAHELGHAAACCYGGARPGVIGFGIYLVFPAFFTNVTDSYRLDRTGRLRTDLGGLYLNVWCLVLLGGLYVATGDGIFLLAALLMHIEMIQQLIPTVRFDGYFVLTDIAGVPDLFARVRPVLRSLVPGRLVDPQVAELRPAARRLVVGWVLLVTPLLLGAFGWLLYHLPYLSERLARAMSRQANLTAHAWDRGAVAAVLLGSISLALLAVPVLGALALVYQLLARSLRPLLSTHPSGDQGVPDALPAGERTVERRSAEPVAGALTARAIDDEAMLGERLSPPERGWRRGVYLLSARRLRPGPSAADRRRSETLARVCAPVPGARHIVVMSRKGGVGKTTVTLALGATYAMVRGDRVVAVDANPDAGNLARRVTRTSARTMTDVLHDVDGIDSYAHLRTYTAQSPESRLEVLASDDDPRIGLALNRESYHRAIELLDRFYNLILLDTGTGILDSANQGLLTEADQLVLVLRPAVDGARAAALTLDWLSEHGYGELVARAVVVINSARSHTAVPVERIEAHFTRRCARVVVIPWDRVLESGAQIVMSDLRPETRDALTELAAAVTDQLTARPPRPPEGDRP